MRRRDTGLPQLLHNPSEIGGLFFSLARSEVGGRGEMSHQAVEVSVRGGTQNSNNLSGTRSCAHPVHSAINLQVVIHRASGIARHAVQLRDITERMNGWCETEGDHVLPLIGQESGHHQNVRLNARMA